MKSLKYRELQQALKSFGAANLKVKLNQCYEVLAAEYHRLTGDTAEKPQQPVVVHQTNYTYRELQSKLKAYREQRLTTIRLNHKREILEAELARIEAGPPAGKSRVEYLPLSMVDQPLSLSMIQHARYSV